MSKKISSLSTSHAPIAGVILAFAALTANAHHGGAVEWQDTVRGPVTGIATKFAFTFPHVVVYVDIEEPDGTEHWAMTTRWTPTILRELGWKRSSIVPGDSVTLTYRPHVTDPAVAQMSTISVNGTELSLQPD
jgi:hypothetical protein